MKTLFLFISCCGLVAGIQAQNFNSSGIYTGTPVAAPFVADFTATPTWTQPLPASGLTSNLTENGGIAFVNCILQNRTPSGGSPVQALRTNGTSSIIYLPRVQNAGKLLIEGFVSNTQRFTVEILDGSRWMPFHTRNFPMPTRSTVTMNVSRNEPVQLRLVQTSGAFLAYTKITLTPYTNDPPTVVSGQTFTSPQAYESINNLIIENCTFRDMTTTASALLVDNCTNVTIRNCTIENITNNGPNSGFALEVNDFSDVLIDRVTIRNHVSPGGHSVALEIDGAASRNITVQNSRIQDVSGGGINTAGSSTVDVEPYKSTHDKPIPGVRILNNVIFNTGLAPDPTTAQNSPKHGMYIKAWDAHIEGNLVYNSYDGQCISIRSTGVVRGNTCYNGRSGPFSYWAQKPAGPSGKLIVENNVFYQTQNVSGPNETRPMHTDVRVLGINQYTDLKFDDFTVRFNTVVLYGTVTTATTTPVVLVGDKYRNVKLYGNLIVDLRTVPNTPKYVSHYWGGLSTAFLAKNTSNYTTNSLDGFVDGSAYDFHLKPTSPAIKYANSETDYPATDIEGEPRRAGYLDAGAYAAAVPVENLMLAPESRALLVGDTAMLTATLLPAFARVGALVWSSSNPAIVSVNSAGKLTATGCGTATITVATPDGSRTASGTVTVSALLPAPVITGTPGRQVVQNTTDLSLSIANCTGTLEWQGQGVVNGNTLTIPASTPAGSYTYTATCRDAVTGCASQATTTVSIVAPYLTVSHRNGDNSPNRLNNNDLRPVFQLANVGAEAIPYEQLSLRYWLTAEQFAPITTAVDYAQIGASKISPRYVSLGAPRQGAFGYVEFRFDPSAGNLAAGANSEEIQTRIYKTSWTSFSETDDYSFADVSALKANARVTLYRNGALIWGQEPALVTPNQTVRVQSANQNSNPGTNTISTYLRINNEGNVPVAYKDLSVRYWFTAEGTQPLNYWVDFAELGNGKVRGRFARQAPPLANADAYFEMALDSALGSLQPLSSTGNIQYRLAKTDWSVFDETNDHSCKPAASMTNNDRITVYYRGNLLWGTEPAAVSGGRLAAPSEEPVFRARVYPNPVLDQASVTIWGAAGEVHLQLTDLMGHVVHEQRVPGELAQRSVPLSLSIQSAGLYVLRVSTAGKSISLKIVKR